jgi:tetratricopeptide (TPR) repeat protein
LERETKRILQEASVIGRAFLYEILRRITELKHHIDTHLSGLERLDLIRVRSLQPDIEYIFKHALTQEVVYNGLLKKERQAIHERVALVMEQLFHDRLSEFYETLAFHFKKSKSTPKAIDYLLKSGEKSMRRYSLDESHNYFKEAFDILLNKTGKTKDEELFLIDILIKWGFVFYWRGAYRELLDLLRAHEGLAESLDDKEMLGMFYAWLGFALYYREKLDEAYQYLSKAIKLGEEVQSHKVIGYACCWLITTCSDLGLLDEAIAFGKRAQEISSNFKSDKELFTITMFGMGMAYFFRGERGKADEVGKILLDYGQRQSYIRSIGWGHLAAGVSHFTAGDFRAAIESFERSTQISVDPFCSYCARYMLGYSYVSLGMLQEGEDVLKEVMRFSENFGTEFLGTSTQALLSIILISKGNLSRGVKLAEEILEVHLKNQSRWRYANMMYILGKVYSQIVQRSGPMSFAFLAANIGFLLRSIPLATKKAEDYLNKAIEIAKEIGAKGILGQANLDLGLLHKAKKREDQARKCFSEAIQLFEKCETEIYLKQAREALASLQ